MIERQNISLPLDTNFSQLQVLRLSVDARHKNDVHFVATLLEDTPEGMTDEEYIAQLKTQGVRARVHEESRQFSLPDLSEVEGKRPVVVGFGPAGMFCALILAKAGLRPLVLERGAAMNERVAAVEALDERGILDPRANRQFGEGGAGTFSDGKLTTGKTSTYNRQVLEWLVAAGAPPEILVNAKPHIGTDVLRNVVVNIRKRIEELGGEVRFLAQVDGVEVEDDALQAVFIGDERIETDAAVFACGHSARDTFVMLKEAGANMMRAPFAVGVRIEHPQVAIDAAQYGTFAGHPALPPADYKLAEHLENGRDVYTFCMCPGGQVVCAASEDGGVVVNGMSLHARDGQNANSALLVAIKPDDLPGDDPLEGVRFQRDIEQAARRAVAAAGGMPNQAPAQVLGDFLATMQGFTPTLAAPKAGRASYQPGTVPCDLRNVLPGFVCEALAQAIPLMGNKIHGFDDADAVLTAPETRSSSPVQVTRSPIYRQSSIRGLYPCGEGCGYAGGIMSAAVDGIQTALAIVEKHAIQHTIQALKTGAPVLVETDTVIGLGVSVFDSATPQVLFDIKRRPADKAIPLLVADPSDLTRYGEDVPSYAKKMARDEWPGALTLIVKASDEVPEAFKGPNGTIALRMPDRLSLQSLIGQLGSPLATTSANISGDVAPALMKDVNPLIRSAAAAEFGELGLPNPANAHRKRTLGKPSRIIDCTGPEPVIIRG